MVFQKIFWKLLITQMKISRSILVLLIFSILLSCTKSLETNNSRRSYSSISQKSYPIEIDINENDTTIFENQIVVDLGSSEFFIETFSGIVGYEIQYLRFGISGYEGDENTRGDFVITYANSTGLIGSPLTLSNIPLNEFSDLQIIQSINHNQSTLAMTQTAMNQENQISINIKGSVDGKPVKFTSTFYIQIKIQSK